MNRREPREITLKDGRKVTVMVEICTPFKDPNPERKPTTRYKKTKPEAGPTTQKDLDKALKKANYASARRFGAPKKHRRRTK